MAERSAPHNESPRRIARRARPAWLAVAVLVLVSALGAPLQAQSFGSASEEAVGPKAHPAQKAFATGDYERAKRLANRHDDTLSLLVRARLAEYDDKLALATRFARAAIGKAVGEEQKARAAAAVGRLLAEQGKWDAAEKHLRAHLKAHPRAHPVRLQLGKLLLARGKRAEAEVILDRFSRFYNDGLLTTARELAWLGDAMQALGSFDDAHYAYEQMYQKDPKFVEGLISWSELLLSKYNVADAERTLREAMEVNARHPRALVTMARLEMTTKNYFDDARGLLDLAAEVAPGYPQMLVTRAELDIYDADCPQAIETADAVLDKRDKYLDAYIIKAACRYLDDDKKGFEAVRDEVLSIKPDFARLYTETARYAGMVHRYVEVVDLNRKALSLQPGHPPALLGLGIGLSRINREDEAVRFLKQAFKADPYNVRAYNMVELYDNTMPKYDFTAYDEFKLRTHRDQTDSLNKLLPPLVTEAIDVFEKKYGHEAHESLAVEIYPNPATFGVRTVGLPHISPHGVCFGRVVIARSPSDANFNWRQVVWHEMAHVYHIQKAGYRVPRWFTEGLAEYETNIKDPAWIRHHDREIAAALDADEIPSVVELDKRFTQARSYKGILRAYHLSSLVIHYIVQTHGFEAINEMLAAFPDKLDTGEVIQAALDQDVETFDKNFEAWLRRKYSNFQHQFVVSIDEIEPARKLSERLDDSPRDAALHAKMAAAKLRIGKADEAKRHIEEALSLDEKNATVRYIAAMIALNQGRARDAYAHATSVLDQFRDGYELRVVLGHTAMMLEQPEAARVHLEAATQLYEDGTEAWANLFKLAESLEDAELQERAEARLFQLDQNDPLIARQRMKRMVDQKRWAEALDAARRWVAIQPLEVRAQRAVADISLEHQRPEQAVEAFEVLVTLRPDEKAAALLEAAAALREAGYPKQAESFAERAAEEGATKAKIDEALQR